MRHCWVALAATLLVPGVVTGCDCGNGGSDAATDSGGDAGATALTFVFYDLANPAASDNPFPGDYLTVADPDTATGIRVAIPAMRNYPFGDQLNTLDGFGIVFGAYVKTTRGIDLTTVAATSLEIYPYDPAGSGSVSPLPGSTDEFSDVLTIAFQPDLPLRPGSSYLVVVQAGVLDFEGLPVGPSAGWEETVASGEADAIVSFLTSRAGLEIEDVLHAHTFTTGTAVEDLVKVREGLVAGPPPVVTVVDAFPPRDAGGDLHPSLLARLPPLPPELDLSLVPTDDIAVVVFGTIETTDYRDAGLAWVIDPATLAPMPQGTLVLDWMMTLPVGTTGDVPMIVFSHALGVCKETLLAMADVLAEYGLGAVGIDAVGHGSRLPGAGACGKNLSLLDFIDPLDLLETRDAFRQTVSDQLHLVRLVMDATSAPPLVDVLPWTGDLATSGDGTSDFGPGPTALIGQSLGSFMGGITSGVEPDIAGVVVNVGGLSFLGALPESLITEASIETAAAAVTMLEPGDTWPYASRYVEPFPGLTGAAPTSVLLQMAVNDDTVPNYTTTDFAIEIGAPLVTPAPAAVMEFGTGTAASPLEPATGETFGLFAFDPVEHEFLLLPDDFMNPGQTLAGQIQAAVFLWTTIDPGFPAPVIIDPNDPIQVGNYVP